MIISVANQKGGVGKTTTTVNLGDLFAREGFRVLIVDTDVQGHVALSLGKQKGPGLYTVLIEKAPIDDAVIEGRPNLDVIASDKRTEIAKLILTGQSFRERALIQALEHADYELILIDLAPSLDILHVAALLASQFVVIPTRLDLLALDGVNELIRSIHELNQQGAGIQDYRILPTFYDRITRETHTNLQLLVQTFGVRVLPPIPQDVKAREASSYGQTLMEYAPTCPAMIGLGKGHPGGYWLAQQRLKEVIYG